MKVPVTGAGGMIGRGVASRLASQGHEVIGIGPRAPESWPGTVQFVETDIRDGAAVRRALTGSDVVAHCAWSSTADERTSYDINVNGTAAVLDAMSATGTGRIVFASSVYTYGERVRDTPPLTETAELRPSAGQHYGMQKARVETMLAGSGAGWVAVRSGLVLGRGVDNLLLRLLAAPLVFDVDGFADRRLQVVHPDDVQRLFVEAITNPGARTGPVNLVAAGDLTVRSLVAAAGQPLVRLPNRLRDIASAPQPAVALLHDMAAVDTALLRDEWGFAPVWRAEECAADFALGVRGRVAIGGRVLSLPWRLARVQDIPAVDTPAADGVAPVLAGIDGANGEFDTPIDPRFPAYVATNLSEALPGPFSPSSASVTVRGARAGGVRIAERLRPGGLVQAEMARRTTGVFGHRLYAAITSAYFMAETVPFVDPKIVITQFFGGTVEDLPVFGAQRPPHQRSGVMKQLRNVAVFGANLVGLSAGARRDTSDFVGDVDQLERLAADAGRLDDRRLQSVMLLARDHVVHGWVLASASIMLCTAYGVILRVLCGRDTTPAAGPELVSAQSLAAVHRLVHAAREDSAVADLLAEPGRHLEVLAERVPDFHAAVFAELDLIGHRGPGEVEMQSLTYADDPELLVRMVAKAVTTPAPEVPGHPPIPIWARPAAAAAAGQLRDREVRRDKMVRAIWVLRTLMREYGRRLVESGDLAGVDDVFYLQVDELDALPPDLADVIARRRAQQRSLEKFVPPPAISGDWHPSTPLATVLEAGETLHGLGVCGGRVRGRVRLVRPETIDDLQPGEVLVAKVTDVGYTPAFAYAAAVVTELGGPLSHAAIVAREFGFPCVVNAPGATRRLPPGALVEVDGRTGGIRVLDLTPDDGVSQPTVRDGNAGR